MEILSLGHSAFLLSMAGAGGEPVRILADPWLSDFAVGDLMARYPRIRLDPADLAPVHGIWLSHGHTDHLDPESLLGLGRSLDPFPPLLLPASLSHLVPLLSEFLPAREIVVLEEDRPFDLRGVALTGFFNPEPRPSNEDDVMVLVATNGREAAMSESDAVLPFDDPGTRDRLASVLLAPEVESAVLLTTKNQLEATMAMVAAKDRTDRMARLGRCLDRTYEEIWALYGPAAEDGDLFGDPRLVRLVGGQGLAAPPGLFPDPNRLLFPIRVEDRVRMEREVAGRCGAAVGIHALVPGETHVPEADGGLRRGPAPVLKLLDREEDRRFDPDAKMPDAFPVAPLRDETRDAAAQEARLLAYLNERFLPHLVGARNPPIEALLGRGGGEWRIRIRYGTVDRHEDRDYRISFGELRFRSAAAEGEAHEHYFANDVEDLLGGRADEFSAFCRSLLPAPAQHLWLSLGMPWLNPDLVERKLRFHFERAARGETNEDWVRAFWTTPRTPDDRGPG